MFSRRILRDSVGTPTLRSEIEGHPNTHGQARLQRRRAWNQRRKSAAISIKIVMIGTSITRLRFTRRVVAKTVIGTGGIPLRSDRPPPQNPRKAITMKTLNMGMKRALLRNKCAARRKDLEVESASLQRQRKAHSLQPARRDEILHGRPKRIRGVSTIQIHGQRSKPLSAAQNGEQNARNSLMRHGCNLSVSPAGIVIIPPQASAARMHPLVSATSMESRL